MKRTIALLWLLLTLAPIGYMFFAISYLSGHGVETQSFEETKAQFDLFFRLQFIVFFGSWGLVASYIVYLFKTPHVPTDKRALWAVVLFLGNMFAMPVFWYLYVWRPLQSKQVGA